MNYRNNRADRIRVDDRERWRSDVVHLRDLRFVDSFHNYASGAFPAHLVCNECAKPFDYDESGVIDGADREFCCRVCARKYHYRANRRENGSDTVKVRFGFRELMQVRRAVNRGRDESRAAGSTETQAAAHGYMSGLAETWRVILGCRMDRYAEIHTANAGETIKPMDFAIDQRHWETIAAWLPSGNSEVAVMGAMEWVGKSPSAYSPIGGAK